MLILQFKGIFKNFASPITKNADNICGIHPRLIIVAGALLVYFYCLPLYGTYLFNDFIIDMLSKSSFKRHLISWDKIFFYYFFALSLSK